MKPFELRVAASAARSLERLPGPAAAAVVEFITGALLEEPQTSGQAADSAACWIPGRPSWGVSHRVCGGRRRRVDPGRPDRTSGRRLSPVVGPSDQEASRSSKREAQSSRSRVLKALWMSRSASFLARVLALVVGGLPFGQTDLDLSSAVLEVELGGDERVAGYLHLAVHAAQFSGMDQQLTLAQRVVVEDVALLVGADVHADEPQLSLFHRCVRVAQVRPSRPGGTSLRSRSGRCRPPTSPRCGSRGRPSCSER